MGYEGKNRVGGPSTYLQLPRSRASYRISRKTIPPTLTHGKESSSSERPAMMELVSAMHHAKISPTLSHSFMLQIQDLNFSSHLGSVSQRDDHGDTNTTWRDYSLGDIINIPHIVPSLDPNASLRKNDFVNSLQTGAVVAKRRPAVIVAIYRKYMTCIPLFTSQGRGFEDRDRSIQDDCLRVRDPSDNRSLWNDYDESQYLTTSPSLQMRDESYLNLTQCYPIWYGYPLTWKGRLNPESTKFLIQAWFESNKKGLLPVEQQDYQWQYSKSTQQMLMPWEVDDRRSIEEAREATEKEQGNETGAPPVSTEM